MKKIFVLTILISLCLYAAGIFKRTGGEPGVLSAYRQRSGNAAAGYRYIISGDYIQSGLPFYLYKAGFGDKNTGYLEDHDSRVGYDFAFTKASNGTAIVVPTCFQCHAEKLNDKLIAGLGNTTRDFTSKQVYNIKPMQDLLLFFLKNLRPKEYKAAYQFTTATQAIDDRLFLQCRGVSGADRLFALLASYRDPETLAWTGRNDLSLGEQAIPSDVPAWWLVKKKNALYYSGEARGDFGKFMMSASLLTMTDTTDAIIIDRHMPDVLSYIMSLEAPVYPGPVDSDLALKGKKIFTSNCSSCHGTYGNGAQYPNKLVAMDIIGTDPLLSRSNFGDTALIRWYNKSWFSKGEHPGWIEPFNGYIAPPLDGIWATAPYFHNGSVPALSMVLNSSSRPTWWKRSFSKKNYDVSRMGLEFQAKRKPGGKRVYDTTIPGYGNDGHLFGDQLSSSERKALLEYLKTI